MVYLAGHGVAQGDEYYYLTQEASSADLTGPARVISFHDRAWPASAPGGLSDLNARVGILRLID